MNTTRIGRGTLAAAAICLATSALAGCGTRGATAPETSGSPSAASSSTPTDTPTESPSASPADPDRGALDVAGLAQGATPGVAHATLTYTGTLATGGTIHGTDGSTTPLPAGSLTQFAALGDGWVADVVDPDTGEEMVFVLKADGSHGTPYAVEGGLAVSHGGNVVAWTGVDGTVYTAHAETDEILTMPKVPQGAGTYRTVGVTSEDCKEGRSSDAGCTVYVNSGGKVYAVTSHGIVDQLPKMLAATTSEGPLLGGMYSVSEDPAGSCSRMLQGWRKTLWRTCDHTLDVIAPDAAHLVGLPAYLDGFGPKTLAILSMEDGSVVRSWSGTARSATYFDQVWEDDAHLLVRTFQGRRWAVVRVGVDGSLEYAVAPVKADSLESPWLLETR
ncbi:hypothetical protein [Nocardioides sp.]|uniref:hypothetical protein n=1 Tax=Nocardioides sp. TaxID=35761 RepID=UPI0035283C80